jgi:hypothetical protein
MTSKKRNSIKRRTNKQKSKFSGSRKQRRNKKTLRRRLVGGGKLLYGGTLDVDYEFVKNNNVNIESCAAKLNELYTTTLTDLRAIDHDKRTKLLAILNRCFTSSSIPTFQLKEPHIWSDITPNNKIVDNYITGKYNSPYKRSQRTVLSKVASFFENNPADLYRLRLLSNCVNVTRNDFVNVFNTEVKYDNKSDSANAFAPLLELADHAHSVFINSYKTLRPNFDERYYEQPLGRYSGWNSGNVDLFLYYFGDFEIYNIRISADEINQTVKRLNKQNLENEEIIKQLFELYNKESIMETFLEKFRLSCIDTLKVLYSVKNHWKTMKILPRNGYQNADGYTFNQFYKSITNIDSGLPDSTLCSWLDNLISELFIFYHNFFKINTNKNILNGTELNNYVEKLEDTSKRSEIYTENDVNDIINKKNEYEKYYKANKIIMDQCILKMNEEIRNIIETNCNRILIYIAMFYEHVSLEQIKEYNSVSYSSDSQWGENELGFINLSMKRNVWLTYRKLKLENLTFNGDNLDAIVRSVLNGEPGGI